MALGEDVTSDGRKETIVFLLLLLIIFSYWTGRETGGFHFCGKEMIVPSSSSPIPSDEKELDRNIFYWRRHRNTTPGPAQQRINAIGNRMTTTGDDDDDGFNSIRPTRPSSSSSFPIFFSSVKASSTASNFLFFLLFVH